MVRLHVVALLLAGVRSQPPSGGSSSSSSTSSGTTCDPCGADASYSETIDTSGTYAKRTIASNGCPNHYNYVCRSGGSNPGLDLSICYSSPLSGQCTGKDTDTCGALGEEGAGTEALVQAYSFDVPAEPVLATSITYDSITSGYTVACTTAAIGVALNGVPIYGGSVSGNCDILDVDDSEGEWTSFDFCGGHGRCLANDCTGDYHYHYPASCLETQIGALSDGHSPQIGWSFDGFPVCAPPAPLATSRPRAAYSC